MTSSLNPDASLLPTSSELMSVTTSAMTAGQLLRQARLKANVHLSVLSVTLKVPVRQLEALEADELDMLKGPAFYRGLASSVCRHLHADPAPILALLPQAATRLKPVSPHFQSTPSVPFLRIGRSSKGAMVSHKVVWSAALMLVLTGALIWLPGPNQWTWLDDVKSLLCLRKSKRLYLFRYRWSPMFICSMTMPHRNPMGCHRAQWIPMR